MSISLSHSYLIEESLKKLENFQGKYYELLVNDILSNKGMESIFLSERKELENKLKEFFTNVFQNLKSLDKIFPTLYNEGKKRIKRGVDKEKMNIITNCVLNNLEKILGMINFDNETKEAWISLSQVLIETMLSSESKIEIIENNNNENQVLNQNNENQEEEKCVDYDALREEVELLKQRLFVKGLQALIKNRRYFLKSYPNVFVGSEMVKFLIEKGEAKDEKEAIDIGNKLIDFDYMHHVNDEQTFKNDNIYYRFRDDEEDNKEYRDLSVAKIRQNCEVGKEGYALVKGFQFWSQRYLVLRNDVGKLFLYDTEASVKPRKVLLIDSKFSCSVNEVTDCKKGYYCFNIIGVNESLLICTKKSVDQEQWIEALVACGATLESTSIETTAKTFWELKATDIDGNERSMSEFKGKVVMVVNGATN